MAFFQPTRTSPKATPKSLPGGGVADSVLNAWDNTISSTSSNAIAALSGLSKRDVHIIDAIVRRVPNATTFPTMFKAYNTVLQEHGLDATNDVVYYKILLKVGVLKGPNWGSRWETAKEQLGYDALLGDGETETEEEPVTPVAAAKAPATKTTYTTRLPPITRNASPERHVTRTRFQGHMFIDPEDDSVASELDAFTVHSHREDEEATASEGGNTEEGTSVDSPTTLVQPAPIRATERNALHLQTNPSSYPPLPSISEFLPVQAKKAQYDRPSFYDPSSAQSSRRSTEESTPVAVARQTQRQVRISDDGLRTTLAPRGAMVSKPPPSNDYEDTWKKIRAERDEKEADRFREIILLERYFHLWVDGLRWIKSTNAEVSKTRDKYLCSIALDKWHSLYESRQQHFKQVTKQFEVSLLRGMFKKWRKKLKHKKMMEWREDMRRRMAQVRQMVNKNLEQRCYLVWRHAYQIRLSESWHERQLLKRFLERWKHAKMLIQDREYNALELEQSFHRRQFVNLWDHWRMKTELYQRGHQISRRIGLRILSTAMTKWRNSLNETRQLESRHDWYLQKTFFAIWRKKSQKLKSMRKKAEKYKARQDAVLVRAIMRVWVAKERGLLLERAVRIRKLQVPWQTWRARMETLKILGQKVETFTNQTNLVIRHSAMTQWRQNFLNRQKLSNLAQQYYEEHLKSRMLVAWRIKLRQYAKMLKQARVARRYLIMRKTWDKWLESLRVKAIQKKTLRKFFDAWRAAAARDQYHRFAQKKVELAMEQRLKRDAMRKWTEHIIFLKLREIETTEKRDNALEKAYYEKWKTARGKCVDMNRLMQSHLLLKNEELVRRAFHGWLVAAKAARNRRLILAEREEEMRLLRLATAWDTWREKLQALRLKPLEKTFRLQQEKNILYRAFVIWNQKTMATPAIRFHNNLLKDKHWRHWRELMPLALQAKKAREFDKKKLLSRILDKWAHAYRNKIALKAVARARYLRLPSGAPRKSMPYSSMLSGALYSSRSAPSAPSATSGRSTSPPSPSEDERDIEEEDEDKREVRSESHFGGVGGGTRFGVRSRLLPLGSRPLRSDKDETEDRQDGRKADFWLELRRRHGRAGPSTARSDTFYDD